MNQEQIQSIREAQQAEYNAPSKPLKKLLQTISNMLHPLLMLTYAALALCIFTPIASVPLALKTYFVGKVFFYTLVLPVLSIWLMHSLHIVGHWALRDRRDRALPLLVNAICYGINAYALQIDGFLPDWVLLTFYGATVLAFLAWLISFWWKISAHAAGGASFATMALVCYLYFPDMMPLWLGLLAIVVVGGVCSIRVYLGRHTLAQVGWGSLLGVLCMSSAHLFF